MISFDEIRSEYGGLICRRCINEEYNANLYPDDCIYETFYLQECPRCKEARRLVYKLRRGATIKTLFK